MTFEEVLDRAVGMLQRRGKLTYRTLRRQFDLDDEALQDLKDELLYSQPVIDEDGRGLIWTGEAVPPSESEADVENRFHVLLPEVMAFLQRNRRVTYRRLRLTFGLDDALLEELRKDLTFQQIARDEQGEGLIWTGEAQSGRPPTAPQAISTDFASAEPAGALASTRSAAQAERRQLTVMFCDLADSTQLSQQLDPEDLREVICAYQATAAEVIQQYEGHMAQYLGDGLLVYFGWPVAHEDDAQRALHAGLGLVEAITTQLNPRLERENGVQLAVRLGIHTGPVVVGEMGGGERHENLATGETVNIAARLEGLATPNTVMISQATARLVVGAFALEDLGHQGLKGVAEPMPVFRAIGPASPPEDEVDDVKMPFLVGRDEEIGILLRRWEQSKADLGQVVLVSGEAGIGKSSLVSTLRHHVRQEKHTRRTFRCSPYHTNSALYPVIDHVQRALQFRPDETPATRLDKIERALDGYSRPLEEAVPLYAALLSVPLPEGHYPVLDMTPQQQRQQTQDALVGWLLEEAERQPTLAIWEDLHWADPSTLELLDMVLEQTPTAPMLHVLTYRPVFEPPWPTRSHMTPITLNRLERPQIEALITHLAGGKALPAEVVEHIVSKTDGVPLYAEELTKMLLQSDLLCQTPNAYVLTGPLTDVAIPDTLQDSLMARLDQLNTAREVVQLGAVLGREFSYDMIAAISPQDETTLQAGLAELVQAELLYRRGRPPRATYIFKHALIQDAAYASLLRGARQQVHQRIAHLLEKRFPETMATQPELVAHHYTEAGQNEQAVVRWQQAGQRAIARSAHPEAIAHLTAGIDGLKTLPETPARAQRELTLQRSLGVSLLATKGYGAPEVAATYIRAQELCQGLSDTTQLFPVLWGLYLWHAMRAEFHTAQELAEQYAALLQGHPDPERSLWSHVMLGCVAFYRGQFGVARQHMEQGLAHDAPQPSRSQNALYGQDPGVMCRIYAAHSLHYLGYPDQALVSMQEAIEHANTPFDLARTLPWSIQLHQLRGETQAAQAQAERGIDLCREHRFDMYLEAAQAMAGWNLVVQGQRAQGLAEIRQAIEEFKNTGAKLFQVTLLVPLTESYGMLDQHDRGLAILSDTLATINQTDERWWEAELHRVRGKLLCARSLDKQDEAEASFHQALSVARHQQAKSWELRTATSLARLWQNQGKRQEAHDLLAPVYGWFTEGFDTADLKEAKALLDELG